MKQTTANRSTCSDSSQRAWRLLSILAAYFGCSEALKPYLIEHLTSAASDRRGTAAVCLTNLRKTARCGGRKNVSSNGIHNEIFSQRCFFYFSGPECRRSYCSFRWSFCKKTNLPFTGWGRKSCEVIFLQNFRKNCL